MARRGWVHHILSAIHFRHRVEAQPPAEGPIRWTPSYDADELKREIIGLVQRLHQKRARGADVLVEGRFYSSDPRYGKPGFGKAQGDILHWDVDVPLLDEDGPATEQGSGYWLLLSNSCDLTRDECEHVQLAPLVPLDDASIYDLEVLERYEYSRAFYLPPWTNGRGMVAQLTQPVTALASAVQRHARVEAHLTRTAWFLLNACLVRFLARDDGRFDFP